MTDRDPMMPPDLDRLLAGATVPAMSAGLIDRIVAEATRPDRAVLPPARPPRSRGRQWTRRGVWTGIVAVNLMLATAVAAAFGGGALTFAKIATVVHHVAERIRAPFHHAEPRTPPTRPAVVHRLAVPAAAILTAPRVAMPMTAPRPFAATPLMTRPRLERTGPLPGPAHPLRPIAIDHARSPPRAGPYAIRHVEQRQHLHEGLRDRMPARVARYGGASPRHPLRGPRAEPRAPMASPVIANPLPRGEEAVGREAPVAERGLQGEGGRRFDGPRWQTPAAATGGTDGRLDERAGLPGQDRTPGWRRRMQGNNPGAGMPGWRRRAGLNGGGAGRPVGAGRMKPPRPGGGGRHRRF